jgi:O-antigen/teichoic acid export membrane protein/glycosyltransferase involved in cell wall biosynthesis
MTVTSNVQRGSHWPLSILSTAGAVINVLLPVVLVRILSPEAIGQYKIVFLYLALVPGLTLAAGFFNGLALWVGRETDQHRVALSGLFIHIISILAGVLVYSFSGLIAGYFGVSSAASQLFAVAVMVSIASRFYEEVAVYFGRIWQGALFAALFDTVRTLSMIYAAVFYRTLEAVIAAHVLISIIKTGISTTLSMRCGWLSSARVTRRDCTAVLAYAIPVGFAGLFGVVFGYADQFVLSHTLSAQEFAMYAIGCLAIPPLLILEHSVTRVTIPELTRCFAAQSSVEAARVYRQMLSQLAFVLMPAAIFLMVFAEPLITLLFTEQYSDAIQYLRLFALTYLLLIFPQDVVARARGDSRWIFRTALFFIVVTLALTVAGAWMFGAVGALGAALFSRFLLRVYAHYYALKVTNWSAHDLLPIAGLVRYLGFSLAGAIVSAPVLVLFHSPLWSLLFGFSLFSSAFLVLFIAFKPATHIEEAATTPTLLMVIPAFRRGGLEELVKNLALAVDQSKRFDVTVIAFDNAMPGGGADLEQEFRNVGLTTSSYRKRSGFSPGAVLFVLRQLQRNRVSVIHTHDLGSLIYASVAALLYPWRVRIVHTQHSFGHLARHARYRIYERLFTRFVDILVVVAPDLEHQYRQVGVHAGKLRCIPNGVHVHTMSQVSSRDSLHCKHVGLAEVADRLWLLNLARISPEKGQDLLLQVITESDELSKLFDQSTGSWSLILAGPERDASFTSELRSASLVRISVKLLGDISQPRELLACSDAVVSMARFEGLPLVALESLAEGRLFIGSDIEGHRMLLPEVVLLPVDNLEGAAEVLHTVLMKLNNSEAEQLKRREFIQKKYSFESMLNQYLGVYEGGAQ